jgi:hypothetical protein
MPHRMIAVTVLLVSFGVVIAPGKIELNGAGSNPLRQTARRIQTLDSVLSSVATVAR